MARETHRSTIYLVRTPNAERVVFLRGEALDLARTWSDLGLKVSVWKGKPTWRKIA